MNSEAGHEAGTERPARPGIPKIETHVAGLDDILHGGLPDGRTTLFVGGPGAGKTVLGLEILYRGAEAGRPGIIISFEETADAIRANARSLGWDLEALERDGRLALVNPQIDHRAVRAGDFSIQGLLAVIAGQIERTGARVVMLDAVDALLRLFPDPHRQADELYNLHNWMTESGVTTLLTVKAAPGGQGKPIYPFLDFLADCVVVLDQRVRDQVTTRRLRVAKFRGSGYLSNEYPFVITPEGVILMPVSSASLQHQPLGDRMSFGNGALDGMLGGGCRRRSAVLIAGPTGCGKTTLACTIADAAARRGERTLYVSFEEGAEAVVSNMRSPGLDLAPLIDAGTLEFLTAMPESMGVEDHLLRIQRAMDRFQPEHIILDAISAVCRIGGEEMAFDLLIRLVSACREQGVTCIYLNQTRVAATFGHISSIGLSSVMDAAIVLDYVWDGDELGRSLYVLESRGSWHSHRRHRLTISDDGIGLEPPAVEPQAEETST